MNAEEIKKSLEGKGAVMEVGSPNDGFAKFFTGKSWLASLSREALIKALSDFILAFLFNARNQSTRIASYLRRLMT